MTRQPFKPCQDPDHEPPYSPPYAMIGKEIESITHICPKCGKTTLITRIK